MKFNLQAPFSPSGDQPEAIDQLVNGLKQGEKAQCLLGVTGSGKTFTMANVIQQAQRPTLILSHNKTLTAQLYGEFKQFFPDNAVEYFVSYYDYYQPEAYVSATDTYIEKDLAINEEIDKLRLRATSELLSGRKDIIVVASVSCIYGMGNPTSFKESIIRLEVGQKIGRKTLLFKLVDNLYSRTENEFDRGTFRVRGEHIDINLPYAEHALRITFWEDEIEELEFINKESSLPIEEIEEAAIFPANLHVAQKDQLPEIIRSIEDELQEQIQYFEDRQLYEEAKRIKERTNEDLEMIRQLGYCSGIENYSRYFDGRQAGTRPFCLLDYFPDDMLVLIDESHVTIPQFRGMHGGDRARKQNLIEYGFRLPSAYDNRPLQFQEFEQILQQTIYISATPADYELQESDGVVVEQIVRPTGLLDPQTEVRKRNYQVDDLLDEIRICVERDERVLVTTITKRMSEELAKYLAKLNIRCRYLHSDIDTMERVEILRDLRLGVFDVLIGINLLREGLDLPEVALVAILDADKEGFLRNYKSLTQTAGRAARNADGRVILYADKITKSMKQMLDETARRRALQMAYNERHQIIPKTVRKSKAEIMKQTSVLDYARTLNNPPTDQVQESDIDYNDIESLQAGIEDYKKKMNKAAKDMDFLSAAEWRDKMFALKKLLEEM